ncbi:MAG: mechanosensitive ion channel family protein [Saprospiraceae bacterium]
MKDSILNYVLQLSAPVVIFFTTIIVAFIFQRLYQKFINHSSLIMKNDPTNYKFVGHAMSAIIYLMGFGWAIYEVPQMRQVANSLLAGAGILAVAAGFASQHALSNIISGLFIVIFKPFRVNDRLLIRDTMQGFVEDITLRHTVIRDFENRRIIIPNTVISDEVIINFDFSNDKIVRPIEFNVAMSSDIDLIREIIQEEIAKHPLSLDNRTMKDIQMGKPKVPVKVIGFTNIGIVIKTWTWAIDAGTAYELTCDVMESIKKKFDEKGVKMALINKNFTYLKQVDRE